MKRFWNPLTGVSRISRHTHSGLHRRMVAPERLESRNAPGALLPVLPLMDGLPDDSSEWEQLSEPIATGNPRSGGLSDTEETELEWDFALDRVVEPFQELQVHREETSPAETTEQNSEPAVPYEIAALDAFFASLGAEVTEESLGSPLENALNTPTETSTSLASSDSSQMATPPKSVSSSDPTAISTPTSTGTVANSGGAEQTPTTADINPSIPTTTAPPPIEIPVDLSSSGIALLQTPIPETEPTVVAQETAPTSVIPQKDAVQDVAPVVNPSPNLAEVEAIAAAGSISTQGTADPLTDQEVEDLLDRAVRVTDRTDAIIAIVDRGGRILGVHVEGGVNNNIPNSDTLVFAIDGAVAKARTAAFFSNNQAALTSRTVRFISQSTITEREIESNPNSTDQEVRGPGFVGPVGLGGHFPPDVKNTPHVDLFAIEHTNRDSLVHPGPDRVRQPATVDNDGNPIGVTGDDILLDERFGADFIAGKEIAAPESYGLVSDMLTEAQSRGIATLPGGVPLYKTDSADGQQKLVGGIGVFFPGTDGYASFEQGFEPGVGQITAERTNAPLVLEAEYTAAVIAANGTTVAGLAPVPGIGFPPLPGGGRIDLVGITLESFGPHPFKDESFLAWGQRTFNEGGDSGDRKQVTPGGTLHIPGETVPEGWLVDPTASAGLTAQEVEDIINRGIAEAELVRSAIRLPLGTRSRMVLAVTDLEGNVLGLFRMEDSTVFSVDVAVAKARNVAYYADATEIKPIDQIDGNGDGIPDVDAGVALTNRTFRFVAEARFPDGVDETTPGPFSTLLTPGIDPATGENLPGVTPEADDFTTVLGFDAFNPGSNFREDVSPDGLQNGVVFFPGSTPLYKNGVLVGGLGISGDGVDQDDVVTFSAAGDFLPRRNANDAIIRVDEVFVRDVRLPYQKFLRNPRA